MDIPSKVSEKERLGRRIFSESDLERIQRKKASTYRLFLEKEGVKKLSVDRIELPSSKNVLIEICNKAAKEREASGFYGWAVITAEEASMDEREVKSSRSEENPYHADIILPDSAIKDRDEQKQHARKLAEKSTLCECS